MASLYTIDDCERETNGGRSGMHLRAASEIFIDQKMLEIKQAEKSDRGIASAAGSARTPARAMEAAGLLGEFRLHW
jgi:hypothetical protein